MDDYETVIGEDEDALYLEDVLEDIDESEFLEDLDEAFESDEDFAERRRRRRRPPRRIVAGKTAKGRGFVKPRPAGRYVTQAQLQAGLARVGRDIRANGTAVKRLAVQVNSTNKTLAAANTRQDSEISGLRKELKKQGGQVKNQSQMALIMMLLTKGPELVAKTGADPDDVKEVTDVVEIKEPDNTLPILMMAMSGGFGGAGGSDDGMNFLPFLLLMDRDKK